jgi:hypothetical protein
MFQIIDKTGMALIVAMVREIDRREKKNLPYGDHIRALMIYLEGAVPGIAQRIREDILWERFQMRYNEPNRDRRRHYGMACRDLFEQRILHVLFEFGYTEYQENDFVIEVKFGADKKYHVMVIRPDRTMLTSEVFKFPWDAFAGIDNYDSLFERM